MSSLSRELVFLILQFLEEEKFKESVHRLEQESGFFFNMKYFEEKVQAGEWDEVEKYLSGFTKVDDNRYSMKIFFEIRKQKYLEALDQQDKAKAVEILVNDLKVFSTFNEDLYKEITQLLTLTNFRENEQLSKYGDTKTARSIMLIELKKLIEANPLFREKLVFPTLKSSRLRTLINQSLNWQHQLCKNPRPNPDIKTLFTDHTCTPPNGALAPTPASLPPAGVAKPTAYPSLGAHGPFPPAAATANANALAGWMANAAASSSVQAAVVTASSLPVPPNQGSILKRPITPPATLGMVDYQSTDHEQLMKRLRPAQSVEEVTYPTSRQHATWSLDDLPRTVACTMHQGSAVTSMDFHPSHHTLLLVGSATGEITLWEVGMRDKLVSKPFKIWEMANCSMPLQATYVKEGSKLSQSVTRVMWSPDGNFMGVAFTKYLIHLYASTGSNDLRQHVEIEAHAGQVNDVTEKNKQPWQLTEIIDPAQCRLVAMPDSTDAANKVARLLYTNSGVGVLALGSNGIQKLWKWVRSEQNPNGKATANVVPQQWQPNSGLLMTNDVTGVNLEEAVPCIALSKNDSYVMSACGGKVSLFNMMTFKVMTTFMPPPPASTFLAFHPQDNNILAIGMEDSTIHIYNVRVDEVKSKLKGHQKRITGLAFSTNLNILVSSGADAQLCIWSIDTWEKRKSVPIQLPAGKAPNGDTRVLFHSDQIRLLVSHETQLAIYDASKMDRIRQWVPQDVLPAPISYAAYSCNSQLVFTSFCDGNVGVFDADSLRLRCRIGPSVYLPPAVLNGSQAVYPYVVAAHPQEPNQFAIGLTDGSVKVMEPLESEGKWGLAPPVDNGMLNGRPASSSTTSNHTPDQVQR
ncbi:hypothetical protein CsSME_00010655 [Camellia sinensis var. sinensis]